jgi:hypothetical protein
MRDSLRDIVRANGCAGRCGLSSNGPFRKWSDRRFGHINLCSRRLASASQTWV